MRQSGNRTYNRNTAADWKINSRHRRAFDKIALGPLSLLSRYRALFIVRRYTSIPVPNADRMSACSVFTPRNIPIFHFGVETRSKRPLRVRKNRIDNFSHLRFSYFYLWNHGSVVRGLLRAEFQSQSPRFNDRRRPREWKSCETLATFWEQKIHSHVGVRLNKRRTVRHLSRRRPKASITCLQILPS